MFLKEQKSKQDISSMEIAKQAVAQLRTGTSRLRRSEMKKRIDYFYGKQLNYLDELLQIQFKYPERLKLQKEILNITEMIVSELAVLYSVNPKRELIEINDNEDIQKLYSKIIDDGKLNSIMSLANKLAKLCKTVLVRPVWREEKIEYDLYTPNMFDVIQDVKNPTKAIGIVYANQIDLTKSKNINNNDTNISSDSFSLENTIFYVWTKEKHFAFTYTMSKSNEVIIELITNENNKNNENPYKILPFIPVYDGVPVDNFFVEGGDDLINANEINNVKLVEKNYLTKMQSFSIPVRKGADNTKDEVIMDPSMLIDLPADDDIRKGSDFYFVSPEAKIEEIQNDINDRLRRVAVKHKLNPDLFVSSGDKSSAESLQLQAYYLGKVIQADKPIYACYEKEIFDVTRIVYNYESKGMKLPEEAELFIDYKDVEIPTTIEQEDAHNLIMFQNGLLSKVDWLMKENPDFRDEEQAEEKLEKIKEEKAEAMQEMVANGLMMANEQQDDNKNDNEDNQNNNQNKPPIQQDGE